MFSRAAVLIAVASVISLAGPVRAAPRHVDTEDDLEPRIEKETDSVKKAKLQIRLARLKLDRGVDACQKDDHEQCHSLLGSFLELMKSSWRGLQSSGRQAVKQPQGFKELDIALREDERLLEDLKHHVPYEDRTQIEKVEKDADQIRNEVLKVLFPAGRSEQAENNPVLRAGARIPVEVRR